MPKNDPSLETFWGGLLLNSCSPLEISLNWCGMACAFCFANLNDPDRRSNMKQLMGLLNSLWEVDEKGKWKKDTYTAHLLREGYPIVFSNHVDPFAPNNEFQTFPILEVLQELNLPFSLQTKGGRKFYDALDMLERPIVFYMSIEQPDDNLSRKIAPGAPVPSERIAMAAEAIRRGHRVCVGINPTVPQWLPEPEVLVSQLAEIGVKSVWVQPLHLSHKQLKNMPQRDKEALGETVINQGLYPRKHPAVHETYVRTRHAAQAYGMEVYDNQQAIRSDYFAPYAEIYPKRFPLMQEWVNWCWDNKQPGDVLYLKDFYEFFLPYLPKGVFRLREHLRAMVIPQLLYGKMIPQRMTYRELLYFIWHHKETLVCPANVRCFAWAGDRGEDDDSWVRVTDDGDPVLVFLPEGRDYDYSNYNQAYTDKHSL